MADATHGARPSHNQEAGMRTFTSQDIDRYIREQPTRDTNAARRV